MRVVKFEGSKYLVVSCKSDEENVKLIKEALIEQLEGCKPTNTEEAINAVLDVVEISGNGLFCWNEDTLGY